MMKHEIQCLRALDGQSGLEDVHFLDRCQRLVCMPKDVIERLNGQR